MANRCVTPLVLLSLLLAIIRCKVTAQDYVEIPGSVVDDGEFVFENDIIRIFVPSIRYAVKGALPECYGSGHRIRKSCTPGSSHNNFVFYESRSWVYKVYAEYIDKVNTLAIEDIELGQNNGSLTITVSGVYPKEALASYIYIGECFTFNQCSRLWANANNFAKGYSVKMTLTFDCESGVFVLHSNSDVALNIDPDLKIKESVGEIDVYVKTITDAVKESLNKLILKEMKEKIVPLPKSFKIYGKTIPFPASVAGKKVSVTDLPNILAKVLPHSHIRSMCPQNRQQN